MTHDVKKQFVQLTHRLNHRYSQQNTCQPTKLFFSAIPLYAITALFLLVTNSAHADLLTEPVNTFENIETRPKVTKTLPDTRQRKQRLAYASNKLENQTFSDNRKHWPRANALIGRWHVMDPKTGIKMLTCTIHRESKGSYYAVVDRVFPSRFTSAGQYCNKCPAPFLDKPIYNMVILWNMTSQGKGVYGNAVGLDYTQGSLYKAEIKLNKAGNMLTLNAKPYEGNLFTKQQWVKVSD